MADIQFNCPKCDTVLAVDESGAGQAAPCPTCGQSVIIPQGPATPSTSSAPSPPPLLPSAPAPPVLAQPGSTLPAAQATPPATAKPKDSGFFGPEKKGIQKGVLGGVIMMAIAVVWFVAGWLAGYIFFYPPILFVIGLYSTIKGAVTGNLAGKRDQ